MARVAITTAVDSAERVGIAAAAVGLDPVYLPCIEIVPSPDEVLDRLRQAAASADWLVVTSQRTIRLLWPDGGVPSIPVAAVGPSTAAAVEAAGGRPAVIGTGGSASLVELLDGMLAGATVVFPHADGADPDVIGALRDEAGSVVAECAYETRPTSPGATPVDAVAFLSPSAVSGWVSSRALEGLTVAAIGDTTGRALEAAGRAVDVMPDRPEVDVLVTAIAERLAREESMR